MAAWLFNFFPRPVRRPLVRRRRTYVPQLLELEERLTPSNWLVENANPSGAGSLAAAVSSADTDTSPAMISFDPTVFTSATTITISAVLSLSNASEPITIDGSGAGPITISGGGGFQVFKTTSSADAVTIENLTITDGSASDGGAIENQSTMTLMNCTVSDSTAKTDGGAIDSTGSGSALTVDDCIISGNSAGTDGGGIYSPSGNLTVDDGSTISGNSAAAKGGGFYAESLATLDDVTISGNSSGGDGGGGEVDNSAVGLVQNCTVSGNTANRGGGFYIDNSSTLTVQTSLVNANTASTDGGGIGNSDYDTSTLFVVNSTISANSAVQGGGIWNEGNAITSCAIENSTISGNQATDGAGMWTTTWTAISYTTFSGNTATDTGGGISGSSANSETVTLQNCLLTGNSALEGGGFFAIGDITVMDSTIAANTAGDAGGGINNSGTLYMVNSTIAGNTAASSGGGLANSSTKLTLLNSIVAGNSAPAAAGPDISNAVAITATYSLIGNTAGSNISGGAGNVLNPANAGLGTLGSNGGPTECIPLLAGSPAIQTATSVATLKTALTDTVTTTVTTTNALAFATTTLDPLSSGSYFTIQIDGEQMQVTAVTVSGTTATLTVTRGANATTAATHTAGAAIYLVSDQRGDLPAFSTPPLTNMGAVSSSAIAYSGLGFTTQPPAIVQANQTFSLVVSAENLIGKPVGDYNGPVTISLANNPGGAALGGTLTTTAVNGVATFTGLSLDKIGTGYTIQATAAGLSSATSSAVNVTASKLVVTTEPPVSVSAGATFSMTVKAEDGSGDVDPTYSGNVTLSLVSNPGGSTLGGTLTATAVNGVATFSNLTLNKIGSGYTIQAVSTGLTTALSGGVTVTASTLVFSIQPPASVGANDAFTVALEAEDGSGDLDPNYSGNVTVSLVNAAGATLSGTLTVAAVNGVATFSTLSVNNSGTNYMIQATSGSLTPATSSAFTVVSEHFVFSFSPPGMVVAGQVFPADVTAQLEDQNGNPLPDPGIVVTLTLPGGNLLGVTSATTDVSGLATFSTLSITTAGTFDIDASSAGVGSASAEIVVTAGAVQSISFTSQPNSTTAGNTLNPVIVTAVDQYGNGVPGVSVTLTISANSFVGTPTVVTDATGQAVFTPLSVDLVGVYTFTAAAAGVTSVSSNQFVITAAAASQLSYQSQPGNAVAGSTISPVTVEAQDQFGNVVSGVAVSIAIAPGTLSGGTTLLTTNAAGQVVFSTLVEDIAGTYSLTASAAGLSSISSNPFVISATSASSLTFLSQPSSTTAGSILNPVTVEVTDQFGNVVAGTTVGIATTIGPLSSGTTPLISNAAGLAVFSDLAENTVGTYTLFASSAGLSNIQSSPFTITAAGVATLAFISQPANTIAGNVMSTVSVLALDPFGNVVPGTVVTIAISPGALTSGTLSQTANAAGLALFVDLVEDVSGTYSFTASASGAANATSNTFTISAAAASSLSFLSQPSSTTAGTILNAVTVQVVDKFGNAVTGTSIGIAIAPGTLSTGTTPLISNAAGQVVFGDLTEDRTGTYSLKASAAGLTSIVSNPFTITPSLATAKLSFVSQPNNTVAGTILHPVTVLLADQYSNAIAGAAINIGLESGSLSAGTTPLTSSATGQVVFSDLAEDIAGTYTLAAFSSGVANAPSNAFIITAAAAANLSYLSQPSSTTAGSILNPVTVQVADKFGNAVAGTAVSIGLSVGTLSTGTSPLVSSLAGQVVFSNLSKDTIGTYTLMASATGLATVLSNPFTISPAAGSALLSFLTQPSSTTAGSILSAVTVRAVDKFGNLVPGVSVSIATTSGSLSTGTTPIVSNSSGLAVFSDLSEDLIGTYTLAASATGLTTIHSSAFIISASSATSLVFVTQPSSTGAGVTLNPITVLASDRFGNVAVSVPVSLTLATGTLSGVTRVSTSTSGQAIFNNLSVTTAGTFALTASAPNLTSVNSNTFTISAGPVYKMAFVNQPATTAAGAVIGPTTLLVADRYGNGVANAAVNIGLVGSKLSTGTTPISTNSAGQAVFSDLTEDTAGSFTLSAATAGLANVVSSPFTITAGATASITFLTQPTNGTAGSNLGAITVKVADQFGNKIATGSVVMSVSSGSLSGPTTATINSLGQAVFSGLSAPQGGVLTLTATDGSASAVSNPFASTNSTDNLQFTTQPAATTAGTVLNPITLSLTDALGDPLPGVTLTMGLAGGVLGGTLTAATNSLGQATFSNLTVSSGGTFALTASAAGVPVAVSNAFTVTGPTASKLVFLTQPGTTTAGNPISTVTVEALDATGRAVAGAAIVMSISSGSLSGTTTMATNASGWAVFTGLSTTTAGTQSLRAASGSATTASSNFMVLGAAPVAVSFLNQPASSFIAGSILNPITALVVDKYGNGVANVSVGLFIYTQNTVDGDTTLTTNAIGQAMFTNLHIDKAGLNNLTLQVAGLPKATSNNFTVTPQMSSAKVTFVTQPASTTAGATLNAVTVQVVDQYGNAVSNATVTVRLSTGTLNGTTSGVSNSLGQVVFNKLSVSTEGTGCTLIATVAGLTSAASTAFNIS